MRDLDIRRALLVNMKALHSEEPDTRVVEELGLCQGESRVDIAVVNGSLSGFEIKSERDTLYRLPGQSNTYSRVFDFVTVVTSVSHLPKVKQIVPPWWGIQVARLCGKTVKLHVQRRPKRNKNIQPSALVQLLWRDEALQILEEKGLVDGYRSKSKRLIWSHLAAVLEVSDLQEVVRQKLKARANWRVGAPQM